jgi:hypothetical protein
MEVFRCVRPKYSEPLEKKAGFSDPSTCINMQEGLTVVAKYTKMDSKTVHPDPEPETNIPECTTNGNCAFSGVSGTDRKNFARSGGRFVLHVDCMLVPASSFNIRANISYLRTRTK